MREIKVCFILETVELLPEELADAIGISPYYCRTSFACTSVAKPYWYIEECSDALSVEEPLKHLKDRLSPKITVIREMCEQFDIRPQISVSVLCDYADRPELVLSPEILSS